MQAFDPDRVRAQVRRESLLSLAFQAPLTEPLMAQYLTRVDGEAALQMLEFLELNLRLRSHEGEDEGSEAGLSRILAWISLLLNARYGDLVVSSSSRSAALLTGLAETTAALGERAAFDATALAPLVKMTMEGKGATGGAAANRDYCIEIVNL